MHTKYYLIPSYDVENLMDSKKIGIDSDLSSFENNRAILENRKLSDANALALFDRNNKLNINTKKTIASKVNAPDTKQAETQTTNMINRESSPMKSTNHGVSHEQILKNDSMFETESQSSFESARDNVYEESMQEEEPVTFNELIQRAERVIKNSVPRGYESNGMTVYKLLLENNIPFDEKLNIIKDGGKVPLEKLMRGIFFSQSHVNSHKQLFKHIAKIIPDGYIRNKKFLALKKAGTPDHRLRGFGVAKLKKLKWLNY